MGSSHDDWKKAEAVAKIIARCPSQVTSLMDYYNVVCPQVSVYCIHDYNTSSKRLCDMSTPKVCTE